MKAFTIITCIVLAAAAIAGEENTVDGVLRIDNPASPPGGVERLQLEELWRAGGPDDEETFFGHLTRVRADDEGNVLLLDSQLQQVLVYTREGEVSGTLFGEGDGPGELRMGCDLLLLDTGEVAAVRRFPGKITTVDAAGTPTDGGFQRTSDGMFAGGDCGGGNLVLGGGFHEQSDQDNAHTDVTTLGSWDAEGNETARYVETRRWVDYRNNYVFNEKEALSDFLYSFAVGPDGRAYVLADRDRYEISVFEPGGDLDRVIGRDFEARPRTDREMTRIKALTERRFRTFPFDISFEYSETEAIIAWYHRGLQVIGDELWVRHCRSSEDLPNGVLVRFDVFDTDGHFQHQVEVPAPGDPLRDGIFRVGPDLVVVVHGFVDSMRSMVGGGRGPLVDEDGEPGPLEVVCYRIVR